jgi:CRISPR/Cas system CMR-associated protein Cmr5 small subunit
MFRFRRYSKRSLEFYASYHSDVPTIIARNVLQTTVKNVLFGNISTTLTSNTVNAISVIAEFGEVKA